MMTIIDIFIYVAFAFFASNLAKKSENYISENNLSPTQWDKYLTYFVLFFTVIGGIRWNVGNDSVSYALIFSYKPIDFESNEKLWTWIVYLFQHFGVHWMFGLAFCAFVQIFFITKILQPYRRLLVFVPFVFFGGRYWPDCMNAVRQMIVGCGFLWASKFIYEKKPILYVGAILIGSLIHQSAIILLPFYFIPNKLDITEKRWLLITILLVCVAVGQVAHLAGLSGYVQTIAGATHYDHYGASMGEMLASGYSDEALSFGPMMLSYLLIPMFIIWFGTELKHKYEDRIPYFNLWFNLAFFYACSYFLVCNLGHIFIRPVMYFSLFQMVIAALLLHHLWTEYIKYGIRQIPTYAFCLIIATNTSWDVVKSSGKVFEPTTYKVAFFHSDQRKWFKL